jgi:hypothetical protein
MARCVGCRNLTARMADDRGRPDSKSLKVTHKSDLESGCQWLGKFCAVDLARLGRLQQLLCITSQSVANRRELWW